MFVSIRRLSLLFMFLLQCHFNSVHCLWICFSDILIVLPALFLANRCHFSMFPTHSVMLTLPSISIIKWLPPQQLKICIGQWQLNFSCESWKTSCKWKPWLFWTKPFVTFNGLFILCEDDVTHINECKIFSIDNNHYGLQVQWHWEVYMLSSLTSGI